MSSDWDAYLSLRGSLEKSRALLGMPAFLRAILVAMLENMVVVWGM